MEIVRETIRRVEAERQFYADGGLVDTIFTVATTRQNFCTLRLHSKGAIFRFGAMRLDMPYVYNQRRIFVVGPVIITIHGTAKSWRFNGIAMISSIECGDLHVHFGGDVAGIRVSHTDVSMDFMPPQYAEGMKICEELLRDRIERTRR